MADPAYPMPVDKAFNERFWSGVADHKLLLQECRDCGHRPYPPRSQCPVCFGDLDWFEAEGTGTVYSFGVVHRPNQPAVFADQTPILIAIIELAEGPRMVSNIIGCDPDEVAIGDEVTVVFEEVDEGVVLPKFELVD